MSDLGEGMVTIKMSINVSSAFLLYFPALKWLHLRWAMLAQCYVLSFTKPLNTTRTFVNDFTDFLARIMPDYNCILIIGAFNIHACYPDKQLVKEFLSLIDSFNLAQPVSDFTLDLGIHSISFFHMVCDKPGHLWQCAFWPHLCIIWRQFFLYCS